MKTEDVRGGIDIGTTVTIRRLLPNLRLKCARKYTYTCNHTIIACYNFMAAINLRRLDGQTPEPLMKKKVFKIQIYTIFIRALTAYDYRDTPDHVYIILILC